MTEAEIAKRADFGAIRYAQLWEDADVLTAALAGDAGRSFVSICSAGDNALALLTLDPARVIVLDLSAAQIECLNLRIGAYRMLEHCQFLELMGARPSPRRAQLLRLALKGQSPETRAFWEGLTDQVVAYGAGGVGKFERYFRVFRRHVLPLVHSRATVRDIFVPRPTAGRATFFETRFNTWRWRLLLKVFFSRVVMGRMGRDKAFFYHVDGSVAAHVERRLRHAAVDTDPSQNPYLHWIMTGTHGEALPMPWRAEHFATIRDRLDRLDVRQAAFETWAVSGDKADGFNLSDIFEYMSPETAAQVYATILGASNPGARLVYWNMMAPRRVPAALAGRIVSQTVLENRLKAIDKAFFYSDFVIEDVR